MAIFNMPVEIQTIIFDQFLFIASYWKTKFTQLVLPNIEAKQKHKKQFKIVLFEFLAYSKKKELEKYIIVNRYCTYKAKPCKMIFESDYSFILYEGICRFSNYRQRITFALEAVSISGPEQIRVEAWGIFQDGVGTTNITNFNLFVTKFINSVTNRNEIT
jgi:hypothetical protein